MKKLIIAIIALLSVSVLAGELDGNKRKGKYSLRKIYKKCMKRGEVKTSTPPVSPASKTQAEWFDLYNLLNVDKDKEEIDKRMEEFGCKPEWKEVKKKTLKDIFTYMYEHASDSSTPARCK